VIAGAALEGHIVAEVDVQVPERSGVMTGFVPAASGHGRYDSGGPAMFVVLPDGRVVSWSAAATRLFGRTPEQVLGHHVRVLLAHGRHDTMAEALDLIAAGSSWSGVLPIANPDGREQEIEFRWEPLAGPGSPPQVAVAARPALPPGRELLGEVGLRLGTTLDLSEIAREVLDITVPRFADRAGVFVLERLLVTGEHTERGTGQVVVRRLASGSGRYLRHVADAAFPPGEVLAFTDDSPYARCVTSGRPVLFDRPDVETIRQVSRHPGGEELISRLASFLVVPLIAHGVVQGLLGFARVAGAAGFSSGDVALADDLAARAAICIDNARLFSRERRTAEALQRGLLPGDPAVPAEVEVTHRYLPAGDHIIGGDWYEIIPLPGGRTGLVVGDAMGHGPEAATVMVQLRAAARVLADLDLAPGEVLRRLDRMAATLKNATFATCVYVVLDPAAGSCAIAQAGHLPPVLALPDGPTLTLDLPTGLPLGLGAAVFDTTEVALPPGATLALYTDGLVEGRSRPFDEGILALRSALARQRGTLHVICDAVIQALRQHDEDDTTLVLARIPGRPVQAPGEA
jgi:PAS domain S-box-containing protein